MAAHAAHCQALIRTLLATRSSCRALHPFHARLVSRVATQLLRTAHCMWTSQSHHLACCATNGDRPSILWCTGGFFSLQVPSACAHCQKMHESMPGPSNSRDIRGGSTSSKPSHNCRADPSGDQCRDPKAFLSPCQHAKCPYSPLCLACLASTVSPYPGTYAPLYAICCDTDFTQDSQSPANVAETQSYSYPGVCMCLRTLQLSAAYPTKGALRCL